MDRDERLARQLKRLAEAQAHANQRMAEAQARTNKKFERLREQLTKYDSAISESQERIINAALDLLDEDGLNELSMRKLASRLHMQAPAIYWHFKNKEVLIDYMAEGILRAEFENVRPRQDDEPWQDWLVGICQRLRRAMLAHRDGGRVVAGAHLFPAVTLMKLFEVSMGSLTSAGIELQHANLIATTAVHFVFGNVIEQQSSPSLDEIGRFLQSSQLHEFPLMQKSIHQTFEQARSGYDEFEDALRLIIGYADK